MTDITEQLRARALQHGGDALLTAAADEIDRLRARVAELESQPADQYTAELVEIDGHAYGLRPGAARVVREALLDARRYKWLRDTPGVSWDELTDGGVSMWVGDASAIRAPSLDAAIDAAMAKDGAPVVLDL